MSNMLVRYMGGPLDGRQAELPFDRSAAVVCPNSCYVVGVDQGRWCAYGFLNSAASKWMVDRERPFPAELVMYYSECRLFREQAAQLAVLEQRREFGTVSALKQFGLESVLAAVGRAEVLEDLWRMKSMATYVGEINIWLDRVINAIGTNFQLSGTGYVYDEGQA